MQNFFKAKSGYAGEQLGMSLENVRKDYTTVNKMYGQRFNLQTGNNISLDVNIPTSARFLLGISVYFNYNNANENPDFLLNINNTDIVKSTGLRTIDINTLQDRLFYPIGLPLSGQDTIQISVNNVLANNTAFFTFHYI